MNALFRVRENANAYDVGPKNVFDPKCAHENANAYDGEPKRTPRAKSNKTQRR